MREQKRTKQSGAVAAVLLDFGLATKSLERYISLQNLSNKILIAQITLHGMM